MSAKRRAKKLKIINEVDNFNRSNVCDELLTVSNYWDWKNKKWPQ